MSKTFTVKKGAAVRVKGENFLVQSLLKPIVPDPRIKGHTLAQLVSLDRIAYRVECTERLEDADLSTADVMRLSKMRDERAAIERPAHERRIGRKELKHLAKRLAAAYEAKDAAKFKAISERINKREDELAGGAA